MVSLPEHMVSAFGKYMEPRNTADEVLSANGLIDSIHKIGKPGENILNEIELKMTFFLL